jgi:hypothetical protein
MSSTLFSPVATERDVPRASVAKKRKIRKGTFSCWECKKRKTRCELEPGSSSACIFCRRRGLSCVSQEYAEPAAAASNAGKGQGFERRRDGGQSTSFQRSIAARDEEWDEQYGFQDENALARTRIHQISLADTAVEPLSLRLLSTLPEPSIATLIMSGGRFFKLPLHIRQRSLQKMSSSILGVQHIAQVSELPTPSDPPVQLAQKLIQLALCLQQLDETRSQRLEGQLKEPVSQVAKRYVGIAARNVTSQDSLVDSLDGVDTIMLEACYHINVGNMRVAWLLFRRALAISQSLGLPRAGSRTETLWFRLVYGDRFLSLILGLPCAIDESSFGKKSAISGDCPH